MYEIHCAVAGVLVELGLEAFAFRRRKEVQENIVIRVEHGVGDVVVWTAFVDGATFAVGKSHLWVAKVFDLNDPLCFEGVVAFLRGNREGDTYHSYGFRDNRCDLGDIIEGWIKVTPGFHLNPEGKRNLGWV